MDFSTIDLQTVRNITDASEYDEGNNIPKSKENSETKSESNSNEIGQLARGADSDWRPSNVSRGSTFNRALIKRALEPRNLDIGYCQKTGDITNLKSGYWIPVTEIRILGY